MSDDDGDGSNARSALEAVWAVFEGRKLKVQYDRWQGGLQPKLLAFSIDINKATRDATRDLFNAVELLFLASLLNPKAFMRMVREKCSFVGESMCKDGLLEELIMLCRLWVSLEDMPSDRKLETWRRDAVMLVLSSGMSRLDSERFLKTREALLALAETPEKRMQ